jgi:uncharacterized DUF497 family protein
MSVQAMRNNPSFRWVIYGYVRKNIDGKCVAGMIRESLAMERIYALFHTGVGVMSRLARESGTIRIISARRMTPRERKAYEG